MVDITREEIWDSDYENEHKGKSKFLKIGLILFLVTFAINVVLIYSFFNLLSKL